MKDVFFKLIRNGLWVDNLNIEKNIIPDLKDNDWEKLFSISTKHTVEGIIFTALEQLDPNSLPSEKILINWTVRISQIENRNKKIIQFLASYSNWLKSLNFYPILLKGQGLAKLYPFPLLRGTGDIDLHLEKSSFSRLINLLKSQNITFDSEGRYDYSYKVNSIIIELHKNKFDLSNPINRRLLDKLFLSQERGIVQTMINSEGIQILAPIWQIVQVNVHILKHQLGFGIGVRQLCDAARLYYNLKGQYDSQELYFIYKKIGILKWVHVLHHMLVKDFGLSKEYLPFEIPQNTDSSWMLEEVWHSGSFGYFDERYFTGSKNFMSLQPASIKRILKSFSYYFRLIPLEALCYILNRFFLKLFKK